MCRKGQGKEAKLGHPGHLLVENRNGLAVSPCVEEAIFTAERDPASVNEAQRIEEMIGWLKTVGLLR